MPRAKKKPSEPPAQFWQGSFGDAYTERNRVEWPERVTFWRHIAELTGATTYLDVGCNAGWNLMALRAVSPQFEMSGLDVNRKALEEAQLAGFDVVEGRADQAVELFGPACAGVVATSGVLIHIPPEELTTTMTAIRDASAGYVLAVEYAAETAQEVEYRGHAGKLWKRPFGRLYEALGLSLVETGVAQGFDQCAWWLLEK